MERNLYHNLLQWKQSTGRKPLILKGARQVGKTYLLKEFGSREYEDVAYFNFEQTPQLKHFFEPDLRPERILLALSTFREKKIHENKTLIILDEIQTCPKALTSLKYFYEEAPAIHLATAGSLLGIRLGEAASFPVGKIHFLHLYPLTFFEFLRGIGKQALCDYLLSKKDFLPLEEPFHEELVSLLKTYLFVGGLPEAILAYHETRDFQEVRARQMSILESYENDFSKYAAKTESLKIAGVWHSAPLQLARETKKFRYAEIKKGGRAAEFEGALFWLAQAGLVHLSTNIKTPLLPLAAYQDESKFKLYLVDTGILAALLGVSAKTIVEGQKLFAQYNGAFVENFVAQELKAAGHALYYWTSESQAEVDFVIHQGEEIFPLEVKAGLSRQKRSLLVYGEKYQPNVLCRATLRNFKQDGKIANYPLYAVSLWPKALGNP